MKNVFSDLYQNTEVFLGSQPHPLECFHIKILNWSQTRSLYVWLALKESSSNARENILVIQWVSVHHDEEFLADVLVIPDFMDVLPLARARPKIWFEYIVISEALLRTLYDQSFSKKIPKETPSPPNPPSPPPPTKKKKKVEELQCRHGESRTCFGLSNVFTLYLARRTFLQSLATYVIGSLLSI